MTTYTTRTSTVWKGYTDILRNGQVAMSCPSDRVEENIAYLKQSAHDHWNRIANRTDDRLVIAGGCAYSIGSEHDNPKGFGGRPWKIWFLDGRTRITTSLWHLGEIPDEWRETLKDNAILK